MNKHYLTRIAFLPFFLLTLHIHANTVPQVLNTLSLTTSIDYAAGESQQGMNNSSLRIPFFVRFHDFDVRKDNNSVVLSWKTVEEVSTDYYVIERSTNGSNYTPLVTIPRKVSNDENSYTYRDKTPLQGKSFYRIRQVDKSFGVAYSPVRPIQLPLPTHLQIVQQSQGITVHYGCEGKKEYILYNMHGNRIRQGIMSRNKCVIDGLAPGLYILSIQTNASVINTQVAIPR